MRLIIFGITLFFCSSLFGQHINTDKVNPLMGTNNNFSLSHGNTLPLVGWPFGMTYWSPESTREGMIMYSYADSLIYGFRATHLPSPWMGDFGTFSLMPQIGIKKNKRERFDHLRHSLEKSSPYNYNIKLPDSHIEVNMTATERCGALQFTFPESTKSSVFFDAPTGGTSYEIRPDESKLVGYVNNNSGGAPDNFACYFVIKFDKPFNSYGILENDTLKTGISGSSKKQLSAFFQFKTSINENITAKVATSFISLAQAELNLKTEVGSKNYNQLKSSNQQVWDNEMNKIELEGGTDGQQRVFYSCFYRTLLFPSKFYEINSEGKSYYYSPYDGRIHQGVMYTNNGLWDTFRAVFPFFTILYPQIHTDFSQSLVNAYKEGGWLPRWMSPGYREIMIGIHASSIFADGYSKGLTNYDTQLAFEGMMKDAYQVNPITIRNKEGLENYNEKGYVLSTVRESVSKTLEYAYSDYCAYVYAKGLGKTDEASAFYNRSFNYKNAFDGNLGMMRAKDKNGHWKTPFDPFAWGGDYTEGNAWHYIWSVFHDPSGLIDLMGGNRYMIKKMDSVFTLPSLSSYAYYGFKIHEITEMELSNMGQYAHGNQPIQHFIYLYNYAQQPYKTQYWARSIANNLYKDSPDGYCGDEDNGQTSAWYLLSAMGFYPVCPGNTEYVIGSPLFSKVKIHLPNQKLFTIEARNNNKENVYIQTAHLNGLLHPKSYILHKDLLNGGVLSFDMGSKPSRWASQPEDLPSSLSRDHFCSTPYLIGTSGVVEPGTHVSFGCLTDSASIYYTTDGTEPTILSKMYQGKIEIRSSVVVKVKAFKNRMQPSQTLVAKFNTDFIEPLAIKPPLKPGLRYDYYEGNWETLPDFSKILSQKQGVVSKIDISPKQRNDMYGITYHGYLFVPADGIYSLYFKSDDGCRFMLNDKIIHEAIGRHGMEEYKEVVKLKKGYYKLHIEFNEISGGEGLQVDIESNFLPKTEIDPSMLFH